MDLSAAYGYRIDWLVSFVAVARHGGFSAGAKAVYRAQSRISGHVAELEKVTGVQLFDRSRSPVMLTPEGRELLATAEDVLRRVAALTTPSGQVRFGAYPSAAAWLFPRVAARVPDVRLLLVEGPSLELERALADGAVDLAIRPVHPLVASEALEHRVLWREPLVAVFAENHPLAGAGRESGRPRGASADLDRRGLRRSAVRVAPGVRLRRAEPGQRLPDEPSRRRCFHWSGMGLVRPLPICSPWRPAT